MMIWINWSKLLRWGISASNGLMRQQASVVVLKTWDSQPLLYTAPDYPIVPSWWGFSLIPAGQRKRALDPVGLFPEESVAESLSFLWSNTLVISSCAICRQNELDRASFGVVILEQKLDKTFVELEVFLAHTHPYFWSLIILFYQTWMLEHLVPTKN